MKVYVVLADGSLEKVYSSEILAAKYITSVQAINRTITWTIVIMDVDEAI